MGHSRDRYGPAGGGRHRLLGYSDDTGPVLMGRHSDSKQGRNDDWVSCDGENRDDPDSWNDPDIVTEPWAESEGADVIWPPPPLPDPCRAELHTSICEQPNDECSRDVGHDGEHECGYTGYRWADSATGAFPSPRDDG